MLPDIEELKFTGGIHRITYGKFHRSLSKVFPCGIFYIAESECIIIYAVIDLRRDPKFIRRHLEQP